MSRFDYVKYDDEANARQGFLKVATENLEREINSMTDSPRYKALALTKLEECYMYIGKAVRDDQIKRNGSAELQEERCNS